MVVLNKIYTKTGDDGTTGLASGERVQKSSLRVAAYGTVDETNAVVGVARLSLDAGNQDHTKVDWMLLRIQNDLFDLGADLATPDRGKPLPYPPLRVTEHQVTRLENEIDELNAALKPLRSFVLPGGCKAGAALHVARTVSRRAERLIVELSQLPDEAVSEAALKFVNRLSDFLFVAGRYVNDRGIGDLLWVPGENR